MALRNLQGTLTIYNFRILINRPYFDGPYIIIPYIGISSPTLTNVSLANYQYSTDGIIWNTLTPTNDTPLNNLTFIPTGNNFTFKWILTNRDIFNKDIFIRIRAVSNTIYTDWVMTTVYFSKIVENLKLIKDMTELPEDYRGIDGSDLLKNAPKFIIQE